MILAQAAQRVERDAALRAPMPLILLRMGVLACAYIYVLIDRGPCIALAARWFPELRRTL